MSFNCLLPFIQYTQCLEARGILESLRSLTCWCRHQVVCCPLEIQCPYWSISPLLRVHCWPHCLLSDWVCQRMCHPCQNQHTSSHENPIHKLSLIFKIKLFHVRQQNELQIPPKHISKWPKIWAKAATCWLVSLSSSQRALHSIFPNTLNVGQQKMQLWFF